MQGSDAAELLRCSGLTEERRAAYEVTSASSDSFFQLCVCVQLSQHRCLPNKDLG